MTKIDIFSGFLGAGKTTLIKKLLKEAYAGERIVLIENEFGEIGVDGSFLRDAGVHITEMNSGCICCSLTGDFRKALHEVAEQFSPDRILIEPSGVGKLSDVAAAVQSVEDAQLQVNSLVTVVDAVRCKMYLRNFGEFFVNQVQNAGCIVLSRTDSLRPERLAAAAELLRGYNQHAPIVTTPWDRLDGAELLAAIEQRDTLETALAALRQEHEAHAHHPHEHDEHCTCGCHDHDHEHEHAHDHDHAHHHHEHDEHCTCGCHDHAHGHGAAEVFTSWGMETARRFTAGELETLLETLEDEHRFGRVLRAKGVVDAADGQWLHFDYVPGEPQLHRGCAGVTGRLCVIGTDLQKDALAALFEGKLA